MNSRAAWTSTARVPPSPRGAAWCRSHLPALAAPAPKPGPKPRRRWPFPFRRHAAHRPRRCALAVPARAARPRHRPPRRPGPAGQEPALSEVEWGKIEHRFGTFQNRLVSLLSAAGIADFAPANALLAEQIAWHNAHKPCRTTGLVPDQAWQLALDENRSKLAPAPPATLCDLHFAIHLRRGCPPDHTIEFLGSRWPIAPTLLKSITILLHPERQFRVIPHPTLPPTFAWPSILAHYSL